jgi:hypothetical protein
MRNAVVDGAAQIEAGPTALGLPAPEEPCAHAPRQAFGERMGFGELLGIDDVPQIDGRELFGARGAFVASAAAAALGVG